MKSVLTIAGSDSSGGAGIEADIKTITAHKLFATCAITALTAQNTTGVFAVEDTSVDMVIGQIEAVCSDIFPDAVKIGMVSSAPIVNAIAESLERFEVRNVVVDPVMVATSGSSLIKTDAIDLIIERLFPQASLITPNKDEAEVLSGMTISTEADMERAAERIQALSGGCRPHVLVKGGHTIKEGAANDLLFTRTGECVWLEGTYIDTPNTHGTGCTLSSALACNLAVGMDIVSACRAAKEYVSGAIAAGLELGHGRGPLNHMWR